MVFFLFVVICGQTSVFFLSRVGVCLLARGVTREVVIHHTLLATTTTTTSLLQYYYFFFSSFLLHSRSGRREKKPEIRVAVGVLLKVVEGRRWWRGL